jgi:hypothetical protein
VAPGGVDAGVESPDAVVSATGDGSADLPSYDGPVPSQQDAAPQLDAAANSAPEPAADAASAPDAGGPPDAAPLPDAAKPDLASTPDLAPDFAPDLAPDLAPADVPAGPADASLPDAKPDTSPDSAPPDTAVDVAPDAAPPLVIDDFESGLPPNRNRLNSPTASDNEVCNRPNGELVCSYSGSGGYHDFIETLNNWCAYDARGYTKLRFKMRTAAAGEQVDVFVGLGVGCAQQPIALLATIASATTMTTYELNISALPRDRLVLVEFDPKATSTQLILDDLQLVP